MTDSGAHPKVKYVYVIESYNSLYMVFCIKTSQCNSRISVPTIDTIRHMIIPDNTFDKIEPTPKLFDRVVNIFLKNCFLC